MRYLIALLCCLSALVQLPAGDALLELRMRKLSSATSVRLLWDDGSGTILELHGDDQSRAEQLRLRLLSRGLVDISLGTHVYSGMMRMFLDPMQVLLPGSFLRSSLWSVRAGSIADGKFALSLSGDVPNGRLHMLLDHERSAGSVLLRLHYGSWFFGTGTFLRSIPWSRESEGWMLPAQKLITNSLAGALWAGTERKTLALVLSAGAAGYRMMTPGYWVMGSCTWQWRFIEGSVGGVVSSGMVGQGPSSELLVISLETSLFPRHPAGLFFFMDYELHEPDPWFRYSLLPGKSSWEIGGEWKEDSYYASLSLKIGISSKRSGVLRYSILTGKYRFVGTSVCWETEIILKDARELSAVLTGELKKDFFQLTGKLGLGVTQDGWELKPKEIAAHFKANWGNAGIRYVFGKGLSVTLEAALVLYPR